MRSRRRERGGRRAVPSASHTRSGTERAGDTAAGRLAGSDSRTEGEAGGRPRGAVPQSSRRPKPGAVRGTGQRSAGRRRRSRTMSDGVPRLRQPHVAVVGDGDPRGPDATRLLEWAEEVGQLLARGGAVVITGGLGGGMRAAARGAAAPGGMTPGILPGADPSDANEWIRLPIATGLGVVRNLVVVTAADSVVAVGGRDR